MGYKRRGPTAVDKLGRWIRSRSVRAQVSMAVSIAAFLLIISFNVFVRNYAFFYFGAQLAHCLGILVLIYKLTITRNCSGLSLKTQELTASFLFMRILSHFIFIHNIYIVLDSLTLLSTLWVIYMIRGKLKMSYMQHLDTMPLSYVLVSCAGVALISLLGHEGYFTVGSLYGFLYIYSKLIEAVSVLPQLLLIQNAKIVEPFTAHYVFALGIARYFVCANWIITLILTKGLVFTQLGGHFLYALMALLAEVVQTFILADFCYYYIKRWTALYEIACMCLRSVYVVGKCCSESLHQDAKTYKV